MPWTLLLCPTFTFQLLNVFFVIEHSQRKVLHFNATRHPTADRVVQQLREALPEAGPYQFAVLDHDSKLGADVMAFLKATGLQPMRTSIQAPWQIGTAERWVGSCRREILDHIITLHEQHLVGLIREYVNYHHEDRISRFTGEGHAEPPAESQPAPVPRVTSIARLSGLHHRYSWCEAA